MDNSPFSPIQSQSLTATSCQISFTDGLSVLVGSSPLLKSTYSKLTSLSGSYVDCNSMLFLKLASEMNIIISIPIFVELTLSWNQQSPHLSWSMNHHSPSLLLVTTPFLLASTVSTGFYLNIWWTWCRLNLLFRWVDSLLFLWNHQLQWMWLFHRKKSSKQISNPVNSCGFLLLHVVNPRMSRTQISQKKTCVDSGLLQNWRFMALGLEYYLSSRW